MAKKSTPYEKESQRQGDVSWAMSQVSAASHKDFYGSLRIVFEQGVIQRILVEESLVPPSRANSKKRG